MCVTVVENKLAQQNSGSFIQTKNSVNGMNNVYTSNDYSQISHAYSYTHLINPQIDEYIDDR